MKIVYSSYYNWPFPILAAYIHLKLLENKTYNSISFEVISDPDNYLIFPPGIMRKISIDKYGNEIYIVANQGIEGVIERTVTGFNKILSNEEEIKFINLDGNMSLFFKFCIHICRFSILKKVAVKLILSALKKDFETIIEQVSNTINVLNKENSK